MFLIYSNYLSLNDTVVNKYVVKSMEVFSVKK